MSRKLMAVLIVACFLLISVSLYAQEKKVPAQEKSSPEFLVKKEQAEKKMKEIESFVDKIDKGKRVAKGDAENFDKLIREHVESVNEAVKQTFADAEAAKSSQGQKGSIKSFLEFEDMAKDHEKRAKAVEGKLDAIEKEIKDGQVELDRNLLESMTPDERKEYLKTMTPNGRETMKKKYPDLLSQVRIENDMPLPYRERINESLYSLYACIPERVVDFFASPAEAAIGAGVGAACAGTYGVACAAAIIAAAAGYLQAYEYMVECLERQCGCVWYRPWCCSGKAWCWTSYLAMCA